MGGDLYLKGPGKIEEWPSYCQRCMIENGNEETLCCANVPMCPDYAKADPLWGVE